MYNKVDLGHLNVYYVVQAENINRLEDTMKNANTKKELIIKAEIMIEQWVRHGCSFAESYQAWEESTTAGRAVKEAVKANFEDYGYTL